MHMLEFHQNDDKHGSCRVIFNGQEIDGCDMNFNQKYTQAHICIANVMQTLKTRDIKVTITGKAEVGQYPVSELMIYAESLLNEQFEPLTHLTRIYEKLNAEEKTNQIINKEVSKIDNNKFDDALEIEFFRLGFDYKKIKGNGSNQNNNGDYEMFEIFSLDNLPGSSQGVSITFTIKDRDNSQSPQIESMTAKLIDEMYSGKIYEIIKKEFSLDFGGLRTKEQIYVEAIQLMKTVSDVNKSLQKELEGLGFDLKNLSEPIESVDRNQLSLKATISDHPKLHPADKIMFEFTAMRSFSNNQCFFIDELNACLIRNSANSQSEEILIKKSWSPYKEYLPTKDEVICLITDLLKLKEINEKFHLDANRSQIKTTHRSANKKGI